MAKSKTDRRLTFAYCTGAVSSAVILLLAGIVAHRAGLLPEQRRPRRDNIRIPADVLAELTAAQAVISNCGNPTNAPRHDTILVRPDDTLECVLRPDIRVTGTMLATPKPYNLDPPVLYLQADTALPPAAAAYVAANRRLQFTYTTDEHGFRTTLPPVRSDRRILIVGDSVAFGIAVNDAETIPSIIQEALGDRYAVDNAAVGSYTGWQAPVSAARHTAARPYHAIVYIACQNDFMQGDDWTAEARTVCTTLRDVGRQHTVPITVILHTYMEYNLRDIFADAKWSPDRLRRTDQLRHDLPAICRELDIAYADFTEVVDAYRRERRSPFAPFALYVDHCHLSPEGNRLLAQQTLDTIQDQIAE